jgi:hypothetical protein
MAGKAGAQEHQACHKDGKRTKRKLHCDTSSEPSSLSEALSLHGIIRIPSKKWTGGEAEKHLPPLTQVTLNAGVEWFALSWDKIIPFIAQAKAFH